MTAPVTLASAKAAVVDGVITALQPQGVKDVKTHHGRFTPATLQKFGAAAPAARVTSAGFVTPGDRDAPISVRLRFTVYLITKDSYTTAVPPVFVPRDVAMDSLANALLAAVNGNKFGTDPALGLDQPTDISGENLYSDEADGLAVLLWSLSWTQGVELDALTPDQYAALAPLTLIDTTMTLASEGGGDIVIEGKADPVQS